MAWNEAEEHDKSICVLPEFYVMVVEVIKDFLRDKDQKSGLCIGEATPTVENAWS